MSIIETFATNAIKGIPKEDLSSETETDFINSVEKVIKNEDVALFFRVEIVDLIQKLRTNLNAEPRIQLTIPDKKKFEISLTYHDGMIYLNCIKPLHYTCILKYQKFDRATRDFLTCERQLVISGGDVNYIHKEIIEWANFFQSAAKRFYPYEYETVYTNIRAKLKELEHTKANIDKLSNDINDFDYRNDAELELMKRSKTQEIENWELDHSKMYELLTNLQEKFDFDVRWN